MNEQRAKNEVRAAAQSADYISVCVCVSERDSESGVVRVVHSKENLQREKERYRQSIR